MKKTAANILIGIITFAGAAAAASADPLTLHEAISIARAQNPEHARLEAEQRALSARKRQAYAPASPVLGLESPGPDVRGLTYTVSQSLGFPGKAGADAKTLEFQARKLANELEVQDQETARAVKSAFCQLWLSSERLRLDEQQRASYEKILKIAERRSVSETTSEVELLILETALEGVDNERTDDESLKEKTSARLNLLLGRPPDLPFEIQPPAMPAYPFSPDLPLLRETLEAHNPALKAESSELQAAGAGLKSARLKALPDFVLTGGYVTRPVFFIGSLSLTLPLYYPFSEREGIKAARGLVEARGAGKRAVEKRLLEALGDQTSALKALGVKLDRYKTKILPLSERAFSVALRNYGYGKIDFSTLKASADTWFNSQEEFTSLLADYAGGMAELEFIVGAPLP